MNPAQVISSTGVVSNKNAKTILGVLIIGTLVYSLYNYHVNIKLNKLRYEVEKSKLEN
jgi:hypothetical protein